VDYFIVNVYADFFYGYTYSFITLALFIRFQER